MRGKSSQLFVQDIQGALGKNASRERKPLVDRRRIGHQTVKRNKGGNRGKHREKAIENYPGRHRQQPIVVHLLVHPPKNSPPIGSEEKPGRPGVRRNDRERAAPGNRLKLPSLSGGVRNRRDVGCPSKSRSGRTSVRTISPARATKVQSFFSCMSSPIRFGALRRRSDRSMSRPCGGRCSTNNAEGARFRWTLTPAVVVKLRFVRPTTDPRRRALAPVTTEQLSSSKEHRHSIPTKPG